MSIASSAAALIRGLLQSLRPAPLVAHACQPDLLPPAPSLEMVMGPDGYGGAFQLFGITRLVRLAV